MPNDSKVHIITQCACFFFQDRPYAQEDKEERQKKTFQDKISPSRSEQSIFIESG